MLLFLFRLTFFFALFELFLNVGEEIDLFATFRNLQLANNQGETGGFVDLRWPAL